MGSLHLTPAMLQHVVGNRVPLALAGLHRTAATAEPNRPGAEVGGQVVDEAHAVGAVVGPEAVAAGSPKCARLKPDLRGIREVNHSGGLERSDPPLPGQTKPQPSRPVSKQDHLQATAALETCSPELRARGVHGVARARVGEVEGRGPGPDH